MPWRGTWAICCYTVADETSQPETLSESALAGAAERVLENLAELEPDLVNAGIFDQNGETVAVTADSPDWPKEARELIDALELASGSEEFDSAHIASTDGEVFVVKESALWLVAVTGRFVLASLTAYDMRMALRDMISPSGGGSPSNLPLGEETSLRAENRGTDLA